MSRVRFLVSGCGFLSSGCRVQSEGIMVLGSECRAAGFRNDEELSVVFRGLGLGCVGLRVLEP